MTVSHFRSKSNDYERTAGDYKNEPKRTQFDTMCHPERSEVLWIERSRGIYLNSHPPSGGFRIFDIYILIFDMLCYDKQTQFHDE